MRTDGQFVMSNELLFLDNNATIKVQFCVVAAQCPNPVDGIKGQKEDCNGDGGFEIDGFGLLHDELLQIFFLLLSCETRQAVAARQTRFDKVAL